MQVEGYHKSLGESALGQIRQKEFIDDACTRDPDPTLGGPGRMGRDDEANPLSCFAQALVRTVVERARDPTGLPASAAGQEVGASEPAPEPRSNSR